MATNFILCFFLQSFYFPVFQCRPPATHPHVLVEAGGLTEGLAAHHALVGPVFLVHVQNVDSQTIPLLKGPDNGT